jgi:hypothetical protein
MNEKGYCEHGNFVGGMGIDWMCPYCEAGVSLKDHLRMVKQERRERQRRQRLFGMGLFFFKRTPFREIGRKMIMKNW